MLNRHPNADPNCRECHGYGYVVIDEEYYAAQTNEHRTEYTTKPVYDYCPCLDKPIEKKLDETIIRTETDYDEF